MRPQGAWFASNNNNNNDNINNNNNNNNNNDNNNNNNNNDDMFLSTSLLQIVWVRTSYGSIQFKLQNYLPWKPKIGVVR